MKITKSRNQREGGFAGASYFDKREGQLCKKHFVRTGIGAVRRYSLREWSRR